MAVNINTHHFYDASHHLMMQSAIKTSITLKFLQFPHAAARDSPDRDTDFGDKPT
jgi:hypothetical protein